MDGFAPRWVYFVVGVLIFLYQTLDNLDGRQARRTGSSSALGEAFDHGADCLSATVLLCFSFSIHHTLVLCCHVRECIELWSCNYFCDAIGLTVRVFWLPLGSVSNVTLEKKLQSFSTSE